LLSFLTLKKTLNICLALKERIAKDINCFSRPFIFRIETFSYCNLKCVSCDTPYANTKEKRIMDFPDLQAIIAKIKESALRVSLYDMGEPLLNKNIYKIIKHVSDEKISTCISTNFNLFEEKDIEKLFDSKLTVLEPCLDGYTQEIYEIYRKGGDVEKVKKNIKAVMDFKLKNGLLLPIVDTQIILFDHLKEELPLIKKFLKDCKVDKITYRKENLSFNSKNTSNFYKKSICKSACFWLYLGMMIRPDGNVYPCDCRGFDRLPYGNILNENLNEIWNNKYYRFSRNLFKKGPDLPYDEEMLKIPCLTCKVFKIQRKMQSVKE